MKIVFLCGCLEPGRDGVGDYTRRLSIALIRQGHEISALAIKDNFVNIPSEENQTVENDCLQVLRIPLSVSLNELLNLTKTWIKKKNPDWLSLQFVPFAFDKKGMPFYLPSFLRGVGTGMRWHFMFHELWVGMKVGGPLKQIFWGWAQKQMIRHLIWSLKPKIIHTQSKLYLAQLLLMGYDAKILSLFSNIPVVDYRMAENVGEQNDFANCEEVSIVVFGSIHPGTPVEQFCLELAQYKLESRKNIKLVFLGRCGTELDYWTETVKSAGLEVEVFAEQEAKNVSLILHKASIGLSTTPLAIADKSGTIAAMCEHGLPVISVTNPWKARKICYTGEIDGVQVYTPGLLSSQLQAKKSFTVTTSKVELIAKQFATALSNL